MFEGMKQFFGMGSKEGVKEPGQPQEGFRAAGSGNEPPKKSGEEIQKEWEERQKADPNAHREQP